jgi:hypothetical protein
MPPSSICSSPRQTLSTQWRAIRLAAASPGLPGGQPAGALKEVPRLSEELVGQAQEPFNKIVGNFPVGASLPKGALKKPDPIAVQPGLYILFGTSAVPVRAGPTTSISPWRSRPRCRIGR